MKPLTTLWQLALVFLLACLPLSAHADLQDDLKRIGERFEKGEITEQQALAELAVIEKLALEQRKSREALTAAEEAAGSALLRQATIPRTSILGPILSYALPIIAFIAVVGVAIFFYGSSFGLNRVADWLAKLRRWMPRVPPIRFSSTRRPPPGSRHSGEVPDHLA